MLEDLFLLSSSHTIVFPSRFSSLLPIGPSYLPTKRRKTFIGRKKDKWQIRIGQYKIGHTRHPPHTSHDTVRTSKNLLISDQSGGCKNLELFERRKEGETVVRWGTRVHGRLPIPNLLFSIFFPIFLHLKLSHFTRERLDESLPHVRDFSTSQTPTSKPL